MRHAEFANPAGSVILPDGRHVTSCGQGVDGVEVLPLWQFIGFAIYPEHHLDLCLVCCAAVQAIMRVYREFHRDVHREAYDPEPIA